MSNVNLEAFEKQSRDLKVAFLKYASASFDQYMESTNDSDYGALIGSISGEAAVNEVSNSVNEKVYQGLLARDFRS